jgi:PIN domain nuclease of toxin-antitoxin system
MKVLLDTHAVLWFLDDVAKLSNAALRTIVEPKNEKYVSIAMAWELAIKISLNKLHFPGGMSNFFNVIEENGFRLIPLQRKYVETVEVLPFYHRDPFDRLLISTAISEDMSIVTADANIRAYDVSCIW